jgi:uncharacterized protein (DUF1684 family)
MFFPIFEFLFESPLMRILSLLFMILLTLNACNQNGDSADDAYLKEINRWKEKRLKRLKSESGWLNLAGLFWLGEGTNTIGSDSSNSIIFPEKAPPKLGIYMLRKGQVSFIPEPGTEILLDGNPIKELDIATDKTGKPTLLESGSLAWFIIERGDQFGIRLRDYEHPAINELTHIETFPAIPAWKIEAQFEAYDEPGRFLYLDKPDKRGMVSIDFNKAFNPPCAFTEYATCPLPPRENFLTVRIEAGEKGIDH